MIEGISGASSPYEMMKMMGGARGGKPPTADEMAAKMGEAVESGTVDSAEMQSRLSERFGEEADGIILADGSLDTEKLSSLVESAKASGQGGPPQFQGAATSEGDETNEMLQAYLDELKESEEGTASLVDQLYGSSSRGNSSYEQLFSVFA